MKKVLSTTKATPMPTHKNYFPYLMTGYSLCVPLPRRKQPCNTWTSIAWSVITVLPDKTVMMMAAFYEGDKVTGRAAVLYDSTTGEIQRYTYQSITGFSNETPFNFSEINKEWLLVGEAKDYIRNLISYFKEINDLEYEKALMEREIRNSMGFAADQFDKDRSAKKESYQYVEPDCDPTSPKAPVYVGPKTKRDPYNLVTKSWGKKGHYRHYKNGKVVYIQPTTVYRKCK